MQKNSISSGAIGPDIFYVIVAITIAVVCIRSGISGLKNRTMELPSEGETIKIKGTPFLGMVYLLLGAFFVGLSLWGLWDLIKLFFSF